MPRLQNGVCKTGADGKKNHDYIMVDSVNPPAQIKTCKYCGNFPVVISPAKSYSSKD